MAVMMPREKWTDERLDDLNKKVDDGFAETKAEMRAGFGRVDGEIKELRREMNARFDSFDARFESIDARFDALSRNLLWGLVTVVVALIGSNAF
jgi:hypothetical protein